jgi:hypothetical protein
VWVWLWRRPCHQNVRGNIKGRANTKITTKNEKHMFSTKNDKNVEKRVWVACVWWCVRVCVWLCVWGVAPAISMPDVCSNSLRHFFFDKNTGFKKNGAASTDGRRNCFFSKNSGVRGDLYL